MREPDKKDVARAPSPAFMGMHNSFKRVSSEPQAPSPPRSLPRPYRLRLAVPARTSSHALWRELSALGRESTRWDFASLLRGELPSPLPAERLLLRIPAHLGCARKLLWSEYTHGSAEARYARELQPLPKLRVPRPGCATSREQGHPWERSICPRRWYSPIRIPAQCHAACNRRLRPGAAEQI